MMWITLLSQLLLFLCSIALVVNIYYFFHSPVDHSPIFYTSHGKLARRLGYFERLLFAMGQVNNTCYIHTVLLLESKVKLDRDHVKKALLMFLQRFPLLRMRVTVDKFMKPCFEEMEDPQSLDFRSMVDENSEDWQHAFKKQINGESLNTRQGPLWRVALLRETCYSRGQESLYKNTLLFTFHHVISDALSIFEFKKKLIEYLGVLYNGGTFEVESLPFRPPIECTMQHLTRPSILERILISIVVTMRKLRIMFFKPKLQNLFLSTFPPYKVAQKTYAVPRNLTSEETMALIRCSKNNNCTVHGAITAATHLAMSQILERNNPSFKTPFSMNTNYTVNIRKECQPKIESDEFGLYAVFDALQITVPSSSMESAEKFWEFARLCTKTVHSGLDSGKHRGLLKFVQCVDVPSFWAQWLHENELGLSKELFNLTNLGALSIDQEEKSPYKFAGSYFALQAAKIGFILGNNIFTVNNRLYWTVEYSPEITTTSQAEDFVDLSLRILLDACAS